MKIIQYNAISIDGFISKLDGDSDWVDANDFENFIETINKAGSLIVGRKTFEQYLNDLYPIENVTNIVLSSNENLNYSFENIIVVSSPNRVKDIANEKGLKEIVLLGGSETNKAFLENKLIDEIIVSDNPLILGKGKGLYSELDENLINLELLEVKKVTDNLINLRYKIVYK